jgi:hypothetical protein
LFEYKHSLINGQMRKQILSVVLFLLLPIILPAQNFNKNDFFEADMALVSNDFARAQKIIGRLLKSSPDNINLNFLNGLCLINLPGQKKESLPYLKTAISSVSSEYRYGDPDEKNAPIEAIKYYAMACKLNNDLTTAIDFFKQYKSMLGAKEKEEALLTDKQIEMCFTAIRLEETPVYFKKTSIGQTLNGDYLYSYPVINNDETMLFYALQGSYNQNDIYIVRNIEGTWGEPVKITTQLGVKGECYPSSVSGDNLRLYITQKTGVSTDIYCSDYAKERWQKMIKLDKPINGSAWDSHASESQDGKKLYFSSDRKGGFGNMDLYVSEKDENGKWTKPVNLGATINSTQNELMPMANSDQTKLFFKSEAHENLGGYDVFVSERAAEINEWGQPKNIGYPLNTTDDDIYFIPVRDGNFAYAIQENPGSISRNEFNLIEIYSENHPRKFEITGQVSLNNSVSGDENTTVEVYSTKNYEKVTTSSTIKPNNNYALELTSGSYMINFINPDYKTYTQFVELPIDYPQDVLTINAVLDLEIPLAEIIPSVTEMPVDEQKNLPESKVNNKLQEVPQSTEPVESIVSDNQKSIDVIQQGYIPTPSYGGKYTIQFLALRKPGNPEEFKCQYPVEIQESNDGYFRYVIGTFSTITDARTTQSCIVDEGYEDAFVREYNLNDYLANASENNSSQYTIQIFAVRTESDVSKLKGFSDLKISLGDDQFYRYTVGVFSSLIMARLELEKIIDNGYPKAYIRKTSEISNY